MTDTVFHGLHPFPPDIEALVLAVHARNPRVFNDLAWAPLDWEEGRFLAEASRLLAGLVEHHGAPAACRRLLEEYRGATGGDR